MCVFVRKPDYLRNPHRYRENIAALTATLQILHADPLTLTFLLTVQTSEYWYECASYH